MVRLIPGLFFFLLLCSSADSWTDYDVRPVPESFSEGSRSMPESKNLGDIVFYPNPAPDSLSDAERFMLFGGHKSDGSRVEPWWNKVYSLAASYDKKFGQLPEELNLETCNAVYYEPVTEQENIFNRSPVTGNYPRLRAQEFSAGDLFIKRLSSEEMAHLLGDPSSWPPGTTDRAYYVRVYGDEGVILSQVVVEADYEKAKDWLPPNPNRP